MIIFPRETICVGKCLAVVKRRRRGSIKRPMMSRSTAKYRGKKWPSARLSYHLNTKHVSRFSRSTTKRFILHHCDNGWCINPSHLYLGTSQDNIRDMYDRHPTVRETIGKRSCGKKPAISRGIKASYDNGIRPRDFGNWRKLSQNERDKIIFRRAKTLKEKWNRMTERQRKNFFSDRLKKAWKTRRKTGI